MCEYSNLEIVRKSKNLTRENLAKLCADDFFDYGHMLLTIRYIETGIPVSPRPRKTYEYKRLAKVLKCKVSDIYGIKAE